MLTKRPRSEVLLATTTCLFIILTGVAGCKTRPSGKDAQKTSDAINDLFSVIGQPISDKAELPNDADKLIAMARDEKHPRRIEAIHRLGNEGDPWDSQEKVTAFLSEALTSNDANLRGPALYAAYWQSLPEVTPERLQHDANDPSPVVRSEVQAVLASWPTKDIPAPLLQLIVAGLKDKDATVREASTSALLGVEWRADAIIDDLRKLTEHPDPKVRSTVLLAMAQAGPHEQDIPAMLAGCRDRDVYVQFGALKALRRLDPRTPGLAEASRHVLATNDEYWDVTAEAVALLGQARPVKPEAVKTLTSLLRNPEKGREVKEACAKALGEMGPAAASAMDVLLASDSFIFQSDLWRVMGKIAPTHPAFVKRLKAALTSDDIPAGVLNVVQDLGPKNHAFAEALLTGMEKLRASGKSFDLQRVLETLPWVHGLDRFRATKMIIPLLDPADENLAGYACQTLEQFGPDAAEAVPALIELARKPAGVHFANVSAISALGAIGGPALKAVPILKTYYADPKKHKARHNSLWHASAVALAQLTPNLAPQIVVGFRKDIKSGDKTTQQRAIYRLAKVGPNAKDALGDLQPLARDANSPLFVPALYAIYRIDPREENLRHGMELIQSNDPRQQKLGCELFYMIGKPAAAALPRLRELHRMGCDATTSYAAGAIHAICGDDVFGRDNSRPG